MTIRRNDPMRIFGRRLAMLALFLLVISVSWGVWGAYHKERESGSLRAQAEERLSDFTKRQAQLDSDITSLQTKRGVEEVLREQYSLGADGEGLIVIVDQPAPTIMQSTSTIMDKIKRAFSWW